MTDTPEHVALEYRKRLMALPPATRMAMACNMFGTARALARSSIVAEGITDEAEIHRRLFLRFYGRDFNQTELSAILRGLGGSEPA